MIDQKQEPARVKLITVLAIGLVCVSSGSIFVRLSQEAPSLTIAFFRMLWAGLLLSPIYWYKRPATGISSWPLQLLTGCALALHFAFWISSLRFTSVAVSVLLVNTSPAVVALFSYFFYLKKTYGFCYNTDKGIEAHKVCNEHT